ncbi:GMP synthetase (glutamine aminotransferase) [Candidatus Zixiibacteriota bacterium]|nr:GMP synthetase (glutamine aminotransferase) [candidate division Zixibacteria bacterium]
MTAQSEMILILDFGSQYTQLIARRVREENIYCEIVPCNADLASYRERNVQGFILSGGPASVKEPGSPRLDKSFFDTDKPILGICYGLQLIADIFGGDLVRSESREYGPARISVTAENPLLKNIPRESRVWMSHGDSIRKLPDGFKSIASTTTLPVAAAVSEKNKIYGVQFHPEVMHTEYGKQILHNFLFDICNCKGDWTTASFIESTVRELREKLGEKKVVLALSGGVDSTVCSLLLKKAIGNNLHAIFVDNGVLRKNEFVDVTKMLSSLGLNLHPVDASELFLERLKGVEDPERKRKIIGNTFIDVFETEAKKLGDIEYLAQGTLYPDVIESVSFKGPSATIKSHHNVGGLKDRMHLKLIEPLRELFKDEVRRLGRQLGLDEQFVGRHPFPGPGLAVRIIGEITPERLAVLREADAIYIEELHKHDQYNKIWQAFAVLLPVKSVGVMGDERTYENVIALRAVTSTDGMTADWAKIPHEILGLISNRIINEVKGVNRVTYDISSKPPATIEWE